jgi:hypothetical protein
MFTTINDKRTTFITTTKRKSTRSSPSHKKLGLFITFWASVLLVSRLKIFPIFDEKIFVYAAAEHEHHHHQRMPPPTRPPPPHHKHHEQHHQNHHPGDENRKEHEQQKQKPPPPPTGRMHARKVDPPLNRNDDVDEQKEQPDPVKTTTPTEKKRMTAQEYVEARKEMKPPPKSPGKEKNFMNEMVSSVLAPGYKFVVGLPKNSLKFVVEKFTSTRAMFRVHAIAMLSSKLLNAGKILDVNKFGVYLADAFLLLFTLTVARIVHLFTPFAKPPPASVRTRKVGSDRVNIQFHMPFAGGADKCIVFLKGNKVLCRCPEKMLECETTLSAPAKGSTWIIFEEPKWLEYKDELVVVAKSVKKDKEAKKIEKMPLKTPAARKKSASRTTDEGEEDRAPAKARASRKTTTATTTKKTPAAKSPASPRRTRQTPAKKK